MLVRDRMRRDVVTIREDDDLATALQIMLWNGFRHLPVLRADDHLVGVLSERDVLRVHDPGKLAFAIEGRVRDAMTLGAVVAHPREDLEDAAARMQTEQVGCLPVLEAGKVVGILTTTDLVAHIAQCPVPEREERGPRADELMTRDPVTAHPDDGLADAAARMVQNGIRHLPVIDGDGQLVGILSDRDVRSAMGNPLDFLGEEPEERLRFVRVSDVMTAEPRRVSTGDPLGLLLPLLVDERYGAVPVVDPDGRLAGIVSYLDVLRVTTGHRNAATTRRA